MVNLDGFDTDNLLKSIDKSKLVQVQVTVKGKNGTFTRKQWKRAKDVTSSDVVLKAPDAPKDKASGKPDTQGTGRQKLAQLLGSGNSRSSIVDFAKKNGVAWKESPHEGINWMRAAMAIQKHMESSPDVWKKFQSQETQKTQSQDSSQSQPTKQAQSNDKPQTQVQSTSNPVDKSKVQDLVKKLGKRDEALKILESNGVTWKKNTHEGINWMRAMQALGKAMSENPNLFDKLLGAKDSQDTKAQLASTQKQVKQLQDLVSQIQKPTAQQVVQQQKQNDILTGITTDTMSDYEKSHFGDAISKASPESLRNYRTLGMCAGDKESEAYLSDLYEKYSKTFNEQLQRDAEAQAKKDLDADPLRNKLQGVVNKQVVGVVKSSLKNARKRSSQFTFQQKLLEPWVDPNAPLTDAQKDYIKTQPNTNNSSSGTLWAVGDRRKACQTEQDCSHTLMHRVLSKFKQSTEYGQLATEYDQLLTEFDQLTQANSWFQNAVNSAGNSKTIENADWYKNDLLSSISGEQDRYNGFIKNAQDTISKYGPGGSEDYTKQTDYWKQRRFKDDYERAQKRIVEFQKHVDELEALKPKVNGEDLKKAAQIRQKMFDPKFTDLNVNLYHYKMIASQLSYQYEIKKDFVSEYPVLSKDNLNKLDAADEDSLTNLSLYAGMFKPSLSKGGKSAKDALMDKYSERQAFLDAYGGVTAIQGAASYAENNEIKCKVSKASAQKSQEIIDNIASDWDKKNHGNMKYKIKGVYEVSGLAVEKEFNQIKKQNSKYAGKTAGGKKCDSDIFYHGTGSMATSLILGHSGEFKLVKAKVGRMLGDGIYLADKSSKSAQYIGDAGYAHHGIQGSLMVVEASLGNTLDARTSGGNKYDSVYAGKEHKLLNSEWCVHDPHAVIPRYLVEMEIL